MEVNVLDKSPVAVKTEALILLFSKEMFKKFKPKTRLDKIIKRVKDNKEFKGEKDQVVSLTGFDLNAKKIILCGLGEEKKLDMEQIRRSLSNAIKPLNVKEFTISLKGIKLPIKDKIKASVESVMLSSYKFDKYKSYPKDNPKIELKKVSILIDGKNKYKDIIDETKIICKNALFVRDLVNENADVMNTLELTKRAKVLTKNKKISVKVLDEKALKKQGLNLILAVGQGSRFPPRLVILNYKGNPNSKDVTAFVGKGVTFDTGGINLKPTPESLINMKIDMTGAGTVLGLVKAAAELKLKRNIIGVMPLVENAIGSRAYKPGDIFKSYSGKTVEIRHTDAEGRLILADALAYVTKNYKPNRVIDLATLTGAALIIFGEHITPLVSNNERLVKGLTNASANTTEKIWNLPLIEEYKEEMKSEPADLRNLPKTSRHAGTITAAAFLENFVNEVPWAHLDIAGTAWSSKGHYYLTPGGTGFGIRLLIDFLKFS